MLRALDEKIKPVAEALGLGEEKTSQTLKLQRESVHAQEKKKRQEEKDARGIAKAVLVLEAQERREAAEENRKVPSDPQEQAFEKAAVEPAPKRRKASVEPQTFQCELCDRSCPTQKVLDKHLGSKVHAKAVALKQVRDAEEKKRRRELRVKKEHFDATFGSGVVGVDSEEDA